MRKNAFILFLFSFFTIIIFRHYVFFNKVPFPGNLLVSFYQPWSSYTWDGYTNGPPSKAIGFDTLRMFYPLRQIVTDSMKSGHLPLWNPYSFAGNVLLGTYQSAVFHPLSILFLLLPQIDAWSVIIILSPIMTASFMYIFLRDLELSRKASVFGAITFAFSGMMIVWWQEMFMSVYSFLPLPLVLFAIKRLFIKTTSSMFLLLIVSLLFSIVSGYFQTTFYLLLMMGSWTLFLLYRYKKRQPLIVIGIAIVCSVLLSGIQLFPAYEAYQLSPRSSTDVQAMFTEFFIPLKHLITFVAPDYYGNPATHNYYASSFYHEKAIWIGIPGLLFALFAVITVKKHNHITIFFAGTSFLFLSLAFSIPTSWFLLYSLHLPFISEMTPSRIIYLASFGLAVLSAIGIDRFFKKNHKSQIIMLCLFFVWIFITAFVPAFEQYHGEKISDKVALRNLIIPFGTLLLTIGAIVLGLIKEQYKILSYVCILVISMGSIGYFSNKYLYFSTREYVYPQTSIIQKLQNTIGINRYISIGDAYIDRNFSNYFRLHSPEGYESFNIQRYSELVSSGFNNGTIPHELTRADVDFRRANSIQELENNPFILSLMKILGIKYVVAKPTTHTNTESNHFKQIWTDDYFALYEYQQAIPRFFLTTSYIVKTNPQEILNTLFSEHIDLSKTIVLEEKIPTTLTSVAKGLVTLTSYKPESISFQVISENETLLYLSDNYFPGWIARINNTETPIYRANYSFRAIVVPSGTNNVTFSYEPTSVKIGYLSSSIGVIMMLIAIYTLKKTHTNLSNS